MKKSTLLPLLFLFTVCLFANFSCKKTMPASVSAEATAEGFNGPITVKVFVAENRIVDASIVAITDTENIGVPASRSIVKKAIKKGTVDGIDIVAGATMSSKAVLAALKEAFAKAQGEKPMGDMANKNSGQ